jgi:tetratricopeptide (TPR) repeat protein
MKLHHRLLTCIILLSLTAHAQSFVLNIKTDKIEYVCGEPVVLDVSLQNTENTLVELPRFLHPSYYEVEYTINEKRFIPWMLVDDLYPTKNFAPGEILEKEVMLFFNGKEWLFQLPGDYTITAKLRGQSSNTLTITIPSPCGENTPLALNKELSPTGESADSASQLLFSSHEAGYFLLFEGEGAQFLTEGVQVLQQIATDYPENPLATYANQALGNSHAFLGNHQEALPFLKTAQQNPVGLYDTVHTHMSLYESYVGSGNTQEAETVLEELKEKISEQFSDFKPFVDAVLNQNGIPTLFELQPNPFIVIGVQSCDRNKILLSTVTGEILQNFDTGMTSKGIRIETGDFDQDKSTDVIVATEIGIGNKILIFDVNGQQINAFQINGDNKGINVAIGDLDNNGTSDIVMVKQSADNQFYIYQTSDANIKEIIFSEEKAKFNLAIGDVNGDKYDEIILVFAEKKNGKNVFILNKEGNLLQSFTALLNGETQEMVVTAGDVNGDTIDEIIVGQAENGYTVAIYKADGNLIKSFNTFDNNVVRKKEKVVICHNGKTLEVSANALKAHLAHGDKKGECDKQEDNKVDKKVTICHIPSGNPDNAKTISISENALGTHLSHGDKKGKCDNSGGTCPLYKRNGLVLATGDVNNDGQLEIIVSKAGGNEIRLYTAEGNLVEQFAINLPNFVITDVGFGILNK